MDVEDLVECPVCVENGQRSCVYPGVGMVTDMYCPPYYDEDGKSHTHDRNINTVEYSCSNGHRWQLNSSGSCWCGWKGMETQVTVLDGA